MILFGLFQKASFVYPSYLPITISVLIRSLLLTYSMQCLPPLKTTDKLSKDTLQRHYGYNITISCEKFAKGL